MTGSDTQVERHWLPSAGGELFLRVWEPPDARAGVVVVPGLGDHSGRYTELAATLTGRGLAVTAYDPRGHGRSSGRRGHAPSFGALLRDLDQVVDRERRRKPAGPWFLVGHSLGGLVVLRWLAEHPGRPTAAVISAPWLATALPVPMWKRALALAVARLAPGLALSNGVRPELISRDPEEARRYAEDPLVHDRISARLYHEVVEAQRGVLSLGGALKVPILFLVPEDDGIADPEVTAGFAGSLPEESAEIVLLAGCRHEPFSDTDRRRTLETVASWLERRLDLELQTA